MKRFASFALAVLLILSLCACSLPQAAPAEEPIDELELVEEAEEAAEAEAPEEVPALPEEAESEALLPEETEPETLLPQDAAETAEARTDLPAEASSEEPCASEETFLPAAQEETQPETAGEAAAPEHTEAPEAPVETAPEAEAPAEAGNAPAEGSSGGSVTVPAPETEGDLVWIPTHGGTKYHCRSGCSNMIDPIQVSRETAIANGFTACKRCY